MIITIERYAKGGVVVDKLSTQTPIELYVKTITDAIAITSSHPENALTMDVYNALAALAAKPETSGIYQLHLESLASSHKAFSKTEIRKHVEAACFSSTVTGAKGPDVNELVTGVEPWSEPVDGNWLGNSIHELIKRYCVLSDSAVTATVLWVISSYAINAFRIFPKLGANSPQKRCGKTTYLETVSSVCNRSLLTSNVTAAVLFRVIEKHQPTLIIDEMDTFLDGNEDMRGIINSGHTKRLASVLRVVGDDHEVKSFSTWTPNILAKIGAFPDTIADRIIMAELQRKLPTDTVERLPSDLNDINFNIRQKCQRWSTDHFEKLSQAIPQTPYVNNDRAEDNWLPLLAVADLLGGHWPEKARNAMRVIESAKAQDDTDDLSISLLKDIKKLIEQYKWLSVVHSAKLVDLLNAMDERPWPTLRNDKGISAHKLASMLKPFGVRSGSKRDPITKENLKGYSIEQLTKLCNRYLASESGVQSVTTSQPHRSTVCSDFNSVTHAKAVTDVKLLTAKSNAACDVVTVQTGVPEDNDLFNDDEATSNGSGGVL